MSYRNDLDALTSRRDALASEVEHKTRELGDAERLLEDARRHARLPVLDNLRVAAPCKAEWSKMTGDERVRHCGDCKTDVFNISELTRAEAEALVIAKHGDLCVRYYQRVDGTILLADCTIGVKRRRRRMKFVAAGAAALLAGGAAGAALLRSGTSGPSSDRNGVAGGYLVDVGKVMPEPPPAPAPAPQAVQPGPPA